MKRREHDKERWHRRPLRWNILLLILFCWAVPVVLTVLVSGVLAVRSQSRRAAEVVSVAVANAAESARQSLDNVVADSVSASYIPTIRDAYGEYRAGGDAVRLHTVCRDFLYQHYSRNPNIAAAYLLFPEVEEDTVYNRCYTFNPDIYAAPQALAFYGSGAVETALALRDTLDTRIGFFAHDGSLYQVRNLSLQAGRMQPYTLLVLKVNTDRLYGGLRSLPWVRGATLKLDGIPLTPPEMAAFEELADHVPEMAGHAIHGEIPGDRYTLDYAVVADLTPLTGELDSQVWVVAVIAAFELVLMGLVLLYLQRQVSRPVAQLSDLAGRIEEGELGAQTPPDTLPNAEFHYLGTQMNQMSARLEYQFERLYREELALRDARIKALQSQINPHFLGNTLEVIGWEARLAGNVKVVQMLEAMTTILRATQDRDQRPLVHLSEEMTYVNAYLTITRERLGKRLEVAVDVDPALLDWDVPRLILQPIVENAIEHSVSKRPRGAVTIRAMRLNESWMRLEVENDAPLSPEDARRIACLLGEGSPGAQRESSGNIGIRNVHQRLRILYGEDSGLQIAETAQGHTVSSMCIQK